MDMIEQQRKLFEELRQLDPGVIEDGVSDEAQYTSAAYRIMYVLKEVKWRFWLESVRSSAQRRQGQGT